MPDLGEWIDRAIAWVEPFYKDYGYLVVLLGAMLEHTFFLAWAIPGGILVALGGLYAYEGVLYLPWTILTGIVGFVAGDHLDYVVGRSSKTFVDRATGGRRPSLETLLRWRAVPALVLAYTNALPRAVVFMGGAASGLDYRRFLLLSVGLATFWSTAFTLLGYWLGTNRALLTTWLQRIGLGGQVILLVALAGGIVYYFLVRKRRQPDAT